MEQILGIKKMLFAHYLFSFFLGNEVYLFLTKLCKEDWRSNPRDSTIDQESYLIKQNSIVKRIYFFREFQLMASAFDNNSLSSNQDINRFLM